MKTLFPRDQFCHYRGARLNLTVYARHPHGIVDVIPNQQQERRMRRGLEALKRRVRKPAEALARYARRWKLAKPSREDRQRIMDQLRRRIEQLEYRLTHFPVGDFRPEEVQTIRHDVRDRVAKKYGHDPI
jgi:CII-binding regulator of phage lambda lysogenization HflD